MAGVTKPYNPATGEELDAVRNTSVDQIGPIIARARNVQRDHWSKLSYKERAVCVQRVKKFLSANAERGAAIIAACNGKTPQDALAAEILPCVMALDWYAKNTAKALKSQSLPCGNILFANKTNTLEYEPLGVVGIISPWNYPFSIPFGEVIMGLMAGNAIVLKVATPTTLVGSFIEECIKAGQFPDGLFAHIVVPGAAASAEMLKAKVNKIFFTGSVGVGKQLMQAASGTLTPLSLELGGKDPMVVLEDADIERAVNCAMWAGFQNAGQSCGGVERIYVHRSLYDTFLASLCSKTKALRHGPSKVPGEVDMGSITTKGQLNTIKAQVEAAVKQGAKIVAQSTPVGDCSKGFFFPATVMTGCTHQMDIMMEETFGPVLPVVPFDTIEEAIELANDCTMALTSSVFSTNSTLAKEVASRLESGVVTINDHLYTHGAQESPWGGWKDSGLGRTHGFLGLKEMSNVRCVNNELVPSSWIPRNMWWYPFSKESFEGLKAGIGFLSPSGVGHFLSSTAKLLPFAVKMMFTKWRPEGAPETPKPKSSGDGSWLGGAVTKAAMLVPVIGGYFVLNGQKA